MNNLKFAALIVLLTFSTLSFADSPSPRLVVHLLDYLSKDYAGAVQNGKVLSQSEYNEQKEFAETIKKTADELPELKNQKEIIFKIGELNKLIEKKKDAAQVTSLAKEIQSSVIAATHLSVVPTSWPNIERGKQLFAQSCVTCHGEAGRGDGLAGKGLEPKPANFLDSEWAKNAYPFQSYNVIKLGVPGTGMASFAHLSDEDVWNLAFYVNSLRWDSEEKESPSQVDSASNATLDLLTGSPDEKLLSQLSQEPSPKKALAYLRTLSKTDIKKNSLSLALGLLDDSFKDYGSGDFGSAKTKALRAYLEGVEPVESRIKSNDPQMVVEIETKMGAVRGGIEKKIAPEELQKLVQAAKEEIREAQELIQDKPLSPTVNFFAAFFILLREGFEAVLIILALLGVTRAAKSKKAERWIHGGWIVALGVGVVTWFSTGWAMSISGAQREVMEGSISLFAVLVLLYVGFWLHRQTEIKRWTTFLNEKVKGALEGNKLIGLATISFMAVFREAFETVLFLRALWLETGDSGKFSLMLGVVSSLGLIFVLSWIALRLSKKLPLRQFFVVSSTVMAALAAILTGKGFHSLQEAGWISITESPVKFRWDFVGLYPTLETVMPQILVIAIIFMVYYIQNRSTQLAAKRIRE